MLRRCVVVLCVLCVIFECGMHVNVLSVFVVCLFVCVFVFFVVLCCVLCCECDVLLLLLLLLLFGLWTYGFVCVL